MSLYCIFAQLISVREKPTSSTPIRLCRVLTILPSLVTSSKKYLPLSPGMLLGIGVSLAAIAESGRATNNAVVINFVYFMREVIYHIGG